MTLVGAVFVLIAAATEGALACAVCFRAEESATTNGIQAAVFVLLGVTVVVLGCVARFIVGFARRERSLHAGKAETSAAPEVQP